MSVHQERARRRNWAKMQVAGIHVPRYSLTEKEGEIVQAIYNLQQMLLKDWDKNTCLLGFKHQKKAKIDLKQILKNNECI